MKIQSPICSSLFLFATFLLVMANTSQAQELSEVDIGRVEVELRVDIADAVERDTDLVNTALVFHNAGLRGVAVRCVGYGANGQVLGEGMTRVPAKGLRYLRASDLSDGVDFVGSALCKANGSVVATSVFLAPGSITDLDVQQRQDLRRSLMRFPLIASY